MRGQPHQKGDAPARQQKTKAAADYRQQHTLGQKLADDTVALGTESRSNGDFFLPRGRSRELQVGKICARNQQDHADRSQQHQQSRARVSHDLLVQVDQLHAPAFLFRVPPLEPAGDGIHFGLCLCNRHTGFQPRDRNILVPGPLRPAEI